MNQTAAFLDVFALELPNGTFPNDMFNSDYDIPALLDGKEASISPGTDSSNGSTRINADFVFPSGHHLSHLNNYTQNNNNRITELTMPSADAASYAANPATPNSFFQMSSYDQFFQQFNPTPQLDQQQQYLPPLPSHIKYHQELQQSLAPLQQQGALQYQTARAQSNVPFGKRQQQSSKSGDFGGDEMSFSLTCPEPGCGKMFNRQFNLKSHLKSHAVERNFLCDACPASFRRSHDLKRHTRSLHSSVKPYECHICVKKFSRMDALRRHMSRPGTTCYNPQAE